MFRYDFDPDEVALVSDAAESELEQLIDAEIIVRDETAEPGPVWRFRHDVLRDVAYASLPKRERERLHTTIAERLEAAGALAWAADHLEAAAAAALDLDPAIDGRPTGRSMRC